MFPGFFPWFRCCWFSCFPCLYHSFFLFVVVVVVFCWLNYLKSHHLIWFGSMWSLFSDKQLGQPFKYILFPTSHGRLFICSTCWVFFTCSHFWVVWRIINYSINGHFLVFFSWFCYRIPEPPMDFVWSRSIRCLVFYIEVLKWLDLKEWIVICLVDYFCNYQI